MDNNLGSWAFLLGVIIALIGGAFAPFLGAAEAWIFLILVLLGLIVGFLNIGQKEVNDFLIAAIAIVTVGFLANLAILDTIVPNLGSVLVSMVTAISALVAPAALVVALKAVYHIGRSPAA